MNHFLFCAMPVQVLKKGQGSEPKQVMRKRSETPHLTPQLKRGALFSILLNTNDLITTHSLNEGYLVQVKTNLKAGTYKCNNHVFQSQNFPFFTYVTTVKNVWISIHNARHAKMEESLSKITIKQHDMHSFKNRIIRMP